MKTLGAIFCSSALLFAACGSGTDDDDSSDTGSDTSSDVSSDVDTGPDITELPATYHGSIRALLEVECTGCHTEGGVGPFPLETWEDVEPRAARMIRAVSSGFMPPWPPEESCRDIRHDRDLSSAELEQLQAWADADYPEGDPADYVAPPPRGGQPTRAADLTMRPPEAYQADVNRPDDYRCLVLDQTFDEDVFFTGSNVLPDATGIVHHVLVYLIEEDEVDAMLARDAAADGPGYTCFGTTGSTGGPIAGWVPGMTPVIYPEGSAGVIPAGSRIVMQVHYNAAAVPAGEEAPFDQTQFELWTMPEGEVPERQVLIVGFPDGSLRIPAGDANVEVTQSVTLPWVAEIIGVAPHMHLLGTEIRGVVHTVAGTDECIVDVPDWDFQWQQFYLFEESARLTILPGDVFEMTCVYDNSMENQPVINGERADPREVRWGDGTLDEMCLIYLIATIPYVVEDGTLCGGFGRCHQQCDVGDSDCYFGCLAIAGSDCNNCHLGGSNECIQQHCLSEGIALAQCLGACSEGTESCLVGPCRSEFDTVYACLDPVIRAGTCDSFYSECELSYE